MVNSIKITKQKLHGNDMTDIYKLRSWIDINNILWDYLSEIPNAVHLLEQNIDNVYWTYLSRNQNAMHLLEKNMDKIDWHYLLRNPNIFTYDYNKMKKNRAISGLVEELIAKVFHPDRLLRICETYKIQFLELMENY